MVAWTAVAYVDATSNDRAQPGKVLPTIIDHSQQSELSCLEAIETLECSLRQGDAVHGRG